MKRAILYTFSGTGNTLAAADQIALALKRMGIDEVDVESITYPPKSLPDPVAYDLCGFGYAIHAFNTPKIVLQYTALLPEANKPAFIFKTSGEPFALNKASSWLLVRQLKKLGYDVMTDTHLLMPYNIMFRYPEALARQMYLHTCSLSKLIALRAVQGERDPLHYAWFLRIHSWVFRIQWFGAWLNGPLYRVNKERCVLCGLCVRQCPKANIKITGDAVSFSSKCCMCMRCTMSCPNDAIRPGLLNPWRVNGRYDYQALLADQNIPANYVNDQTKGYFRSFRNYYRRTEAELKRRGIIA